MKVAMFMVYGDNGCGEEATVFGLYPTEKQAQKRVATLEEAFAEGNDGCEYIRYDAITFDPKKGSDFVVHVA